MPQLEGLNDGATAVSWPMHARWAIDGLLRLDESNAGFLRAYLVASPIRRRVIEAVLAVVALNSPDALLDRLGICLGGGESCVGALARALHSEQLKPLLKAAFSSTPAGFLPAVARSTFRRPQSYRRLHQMLSQRDDRAKARALAYCDLTDELLDFADLLPEPLLRPDFLCSVRNVDEARLIAATLGALQEFSLAALDAPVLRQIENVRAFRKLIERALCGTTFPAPPAPNEPAVMEPVTNGAHLRRLSRKYRNCLDGAGFALEILSGRLFIYEFCGEPGAIVSVRRLNGPTRTWLVSSIDGHENRSVRQETQSAITHWFERHGLATLGRPDRPLALECVAQLLRGSLIGLEDHIYG